MGFKPSVRASATEFEVITYETGYAVFALDYVALTWFNAKDKDPAKPAFRFAWKDDDGDAHREWIGCTQELAFNEKSGFYNRLAALAGLPAMVREDWSVGEGEDAASHLDITFAGMPEEYDFDELLNMVRDSKTQMGLQDDGKAIYLKVESIKYKGEELMGKKCQLNMKPKVDRDGKTVEGNKTGWDAAVPLNATGGGKKKSGNAAPPPSAAAPAAAMP